MKITMDNFKWAAIVLLTGALAYFHIGMIKYERLYQKELYNTSSYIMKYDSLSNKYNALEQSYQKLDSSDIILKKEFKQLKLDYATLQSQLTDLENNMETIPYDSSYTYTMHRYPPTQDSLPYRYAPNQVRSIHRDLLAFDITKKLNTNLNLQLLVSDSLYNNMSLRFNTCDQQKSILLQKNDILNRRVNDYATINEKNKKIFRVVTTAAGTIILIETGYIIIKALL